MIRPLDNRVIVKPFPAETLRASGILLIESAEKPLSGEVIAVGPGRKTDHGVDPMQLAVGDKVMFTKYAPQLFEYGGETLISMSEMDILFVMEN